jgi:hypothetical protein
MDQYTRRMVPSDGVYSKEECYIAIKYKILNYIR